MPVTDARNTTVMERGKTEWQCRTVLPSGADISHAGPPSDPTVEVINVLDTRICYHLPSLLIAENCKSVPFIYEPVIIYPSD